MVFYCWHTCIAQGAHSLQTDILKQSERLLDFFNARCTKAFAVYDFNVFRRTAYCTGPGTFLKNNTIPIDTDREACTSFEAKASADLLGDHDSS